MPRVHRIPAPGELWLSRPPYVFLTRVLDAPADGDGHIAYELLDDDGTVLTGPITEALDGSWWRNFQPLERRYG
jgi:hypothetical protein